MKTARHPSRNRSRFRQTGRVVKNKRAPDVRLVESGHQNQTHRLAQRFCWLEPAVPPPLPPSPLIPPLTFLSLPLSSPFLVCPFLYLSLPSFLHNLSTFDPPAFRPSTFTLKLPHTLVLTPLPHFRLWAAGRQRGMRGLGRLFFFSALTAAVSYGYPPPPHRALHVNRHFFRQRFIYTLTENYTRRTVPVASHDASLFCLRSRTTQANTFDYKLALFKPLQETSLDIF